jgi:peptidoglycan/LPS O-acetylase OafA/YrhL
MNTPPRRYIRSLTSARFFAALFIVLMHFSIYFPYNAYTNFVLLQGGIGVCFFFILSGFVLTYTYYELFKDGVDLKKYIDFLRTRFARVYPMYLISLMVVTIILLYFIGHDRQLVEKLYYVSITPGFLTVSWLANLLLLQTFIPYPPLQQIWNAPSWAVGCEFFFYALFPFMISYLAHRSAKGVKIRNMLILLFLLSMVLLVSAVLAIWYQPIFSGDSRLQVFGYAVVRMPLFRIPEFILGCLAGLFFTRSFENNNNNNNSPFMSFLMVRQNRDRFLLIGLLMIPAIICGHSLANMVLGPDYAIRSLPGFTLEAFFWYFAYMLPFTMVITGLSCGDNFLSPMLDHPMLVFLGEASYSLYIIHWIPLVALDLMQYEKGGWPGDLTILAIIAGIILLSGVCYKYVETPARKAIRSNLKKEKIALTT